jgi:hypothetical protein
MLRVLRLPASKKPSLKRKPVQHERRYPHPRCAAKTPHEPLAIPIHILGVW